LQLSRITSVCKTERCNNVDLAQSLCSNIVPFDRGIFGPSKTFLNRDANRWVNTDQNRKVTRMQTGILIGGAWKRAAPVSNAVGAFKATGIIPLDQNVSLDHFFSIFDAAKISEATKLMAPSHQLIIRLNTVLQQEREHIAWHLCK
jgi:hypothetical protein